MRRNNKINPFSLYSGPEDRPTIGILNRRRSLEIDQFSDRRQDEALPGKENLLKDYNIKIWLAAIFAGLAILGCRTIYLQLYRGDYYRAVAEGNRIRINNIKATRGIIYDRQKTPLVSNIPDFNLTVIPVDLPKDRTERERIFADLAGVSGKAAAEVSELISGQSAYSYQPVIIAENISADQAILIKIISSRYPAVNLSVNNTRYYPASTSTPSLSHLLGYEGKIGESKREEYLANNYQLDDYVGKAGLELFYEKELKGVNGREQVEVDATGKAKEIMASQKAVSGQNLVLTIDKRLQAVAEDSLASAIRAAGKTKGAAVVLDPSTGAILALVSWPAYDNNLFSHGISQADFSSLIDNPSQPLFNRVISGEYPSGSTFKMIIGAAALQEGLITENTGFYSVGGIAVKSWFFPDWKAGGHGYTNIIKALAESVNTFFYIVGGGYEDFTGLGVARIKKYAELFGLNSKLGIDLPQEASGFMPSEEWKEETKNEMWYIGDTYHLAIGQGDILVTPLQVAAYTSVIANGGKLYRPHLVKQLLDSENRLVKEIEPQIISRDFIDQINLKIIQRGLRQAVLSGSARSLNGLPVSVAAKTGTAEWSDKYPPQAWVTAFAPYEKPEIVVTVLVEEGGEGSVTALPAVRKIIDWWAQNRK